MNEMYMFLSSRDSLEFFPGNRAHRFEIKLPGPLRLEGRWKCALTELVYFPSFTGDRPKQIYVCCDLVHDSYVADTMLPVVRTVPVPTAISTKTSLTFPQNYYFSLSRTEIQYINVFVKDQDLNDPEFSQEPLSCTLHLVREWNRSGTDWDRTPSTGTSSDWRKGTNPRERGN